MIEWTKEEMNEILAVLRDIRDESDEVCDEVLKDPNFRYGGPRAHRLYDFTRYMEVQAEELQHKMNMIFQRRVDADVAKYKAEKEKEDHA